MVFGLLLTLLACGSDPAGTKSADPGVEPDDSADDSAEDSAEDEGDSTPSGAKDAGGGPKDAGSPPPSAPKDAGISKPAVTDSGSTVSTPSDSGTAPSSDAGKPVVAVDAGTAGLGGIMFPDLFPAAPDAGPSAPTSDGGAVAPGTRDPNGPCKDLMLFCFDPIDMFLFNADCFTCNGGKGCQGCAIPYAY